MLRMRRTVKYLCATIMLILGSIGVAQTQQSHEQFVLHEHAQITYNKVKMRSRFYKIEAGDALVFEYISDNGGEPGNESEAKSYISFQIPEDVKEFEYTDANLQQIGAIYVQDCRCQDRGIMRIETGSIKGVKRKKDEWDVELDLSIKGYLTGYIYRYKRTSTYMATPSE